VRQSSIPNHLLAETRIQLEHLFQQSQEPSWYAQVAIEISGDSVYQDRFLAYIQGGEIRIHQAEIEGFLEK
jgi:hypothetical protein